MNDVEKAQEMIKAIYDDSEMEINGRKYRFTTMQHKRRRRVFAFYTHVMSQVQANDFSFLDTPEFEKVEQVLADSITYNDSLLSRIDNHWDKYPGDYMQFITVAMGVISYPFLAGGLSG